MECKVYPVSINSSLIRSLVNQLKEMKTLFLLEGFELETSKILAEVELNKQPEIKVSHSTLSILISWAIPDLKESSNWLLGLGGSIGSTTSTRKEVWHFVCSIGIKEKSLLGFEPTTSWSCGRCSTNELQPMLKVDLTRLPLPDGWPVQVWELTFNWKIRDR